MSSATSHQQTIPSATPLIDILPWWVWLPAPLVAAVFLGFVAVHTTKNVGLMTGCRKLPNIWYWFIAVTAGWMGAGGAWMLAFKPHWAMWPCVFVSGIATPIIVRIFMGYMIERYPRVYDFIRVDFPEEQGNGDDAVETNERTMFGSFVKKKKK